MTPFCQSYWNERFFKSAFHGVLRRNFFLLPLYVSHPSFPFSFTSYSSVSCCFIICTAEFNILPTPIHLTYCDQNNPNIMAFSHKSFNDFLIFYQIKYKFHVCTSKTYHNLFLTYLFFISHIFLTLDLKSGHSGLLPRP